VADTWVATAQAVAYASGKSMLDVLNGAGSGRVVRCYRFMHFNNGVAAVVGVLTEMRVNRTSAASAGTTVTPVAHDTNNTALAAQITAGTGRTVTVSVLLRKYLFVNEEPVVAGSAMPNFLILVPNCLIFDAGYADTNVQPLTAREGQGYEMRQQGTSAVGSSDHEITFTNAAT
jgi:hypothetical protein